MQRLYTSETWSLRVKFDFMITHKCHLQKTPGNYQKKNCCNKVKHHYKFTSFPMIDYSPIWQSIIQFFTFHSIHKPKTVKTDLFSKASKFLNAYSKNHKEAILNQGISTLPHPCLPTSSPLLQAKPLLKHLNSQVINYFVPLAQVPILQIYCVPIG